jgi:hypothetical protein
MDYIARLDFKLLFCVHALKQIREVSITVSIH